MDNSPELKTLIQNNAHLFWYSNDSEKEICPCRRQLNLMCRNVKFFFLNFDYPVSHSVVVQKAISIPTLLNRAAMKAFALGRRSKWKDYADLYFIIKEHYSVGLTSNRAAEIFGNMFSEKLFRGQLSYFLGVSFEEKIVFMPGFDVSESLIKDFLVNASLEDF